MNILHHIKMNLLKIIVIVIGILLLIVTCKQESLRTTKTNENKILFQEIMQVAEKKPSTRIERKPSIKPLEFIAKAETAVRILKSYGGGEKAIKKLSSNQQTLLSSSVALNSLEPAGWWTPNETSGGIDPNAKLAILGGEYWNVDMTNGVDVSYQDALNFLSFNGAPNSMLDAGALFPTGGPNGLMQFEFGTAPTTILGIFKLDGLGANVDIYMDESLIASYFVNSSVDDYPFLVNVSDGYHRITAIYSSSSISAGAQGLDFWSLTLYVI